VATGLVLSPTQPLVIKVNGTQALKLEPTAGTPNVIGGFSGNVAFSGSEGATIAGGGSSGNVNSTAGNFTTVGGGQKNTAGNEFATVGGGETNIAAGFAATVGGGLGNAAGNDRATVSGGYNNTAGGQYAAVAGGYNNAASGLSSYAAGNQAKADDNGAFVWADSHLLDFHSNTFPCTGQGSCTPTSGVNTFNARATGGVRFVTGIDGSGNATNGCYIAAGGGAWNCVSDRRAKRGFRKVDYDALLRVLARMDVSTWSYKSQSPSIRHMGPTAQAFSRAFHLGEDRTTINSIDESGVALAAIKGLYSKLKDERARTAGLRHEVRTLRSRLEHQESQIRRLQAQMRRLLTSIEKP
jgi:hypothetical protein